MLSGNFVTKVIYLPDPEFQGDALVGVDVLVSNRLDIGVDPIVEADRRGSILAIIRLGNKDIELAGVSGGSAGGIAGMAPPMMGGGGLPPHIAGMTGPQYGMTYTGTPIGLAGPPHIPLGAPAGLKSHVMRNSTSRHIPPPVENMKINVRSVPGQSYPKPADRIRIREQNIHPGVPTGMPAYMSRSQSVTGASATGSGEYCPPE